MTDHIENAKTLLRGLSDEKLDEYYARSMRLMVDGAYRKGVKKLLTSRGGRVTDARIDRANDAAQDLLVAEFARRGRAIPTGKAVEEMFEEIVR
jgi:hypothetical protein